MILPSSTLYYGFWGNMVQDYLLALGIFLLALIVFRLFRKIIVVYLHSIAKRTSTSLDDNLVEVVRSIKWGFYLLVSLWLAFRVLIVNPWLEKGLAALLMIIIVYQVILALQIILKWVISKNSKEQSSMSTLLNVLIKVVLWTLGAILILSNLGVNVNSLLAGVGIGGVAVALALQNVLGDLLSSLTIYFDKPFVEGDFIDYNGQSGTIESIGFRTTRMRSLQGEEVVIPNADLTTNKVHNYKKMENRRVVLSLGVVYDTPSTKLRKIPKMMKEIIGAVKSAKFDRAHFKEFGDSALLFEIVYYVETGEYDKYMDVNQKINLKIKTEFEKEKIAMAFPTQTLYLKKED